MYESRYTSNVFAFDCSDVSGVHSACSGQVKRHRRDGTEKTRLVQRSPRRLPRERFSVEGVGHEGVFKKANSCFCRFWRNVWLHIWIR